MDKNFENEAWKDIPGFEGKYQVSNYGRVKQADKEVEVTVQTVEKRIIPGKILKLPKGKVRLCSNGEITNLSANKLVSELFKAETEKINKVTDLPGEIWKDIKGYEGFYQVSNFGRVKSLDRTIITKEGKKVFRCEQLVSQHLDRKIKGEAYYKVDLNKSGKSKRLSVHRLVAIALVENPNPKKFNTVNHLDENKLNNKAENLEWTDNSGNVRYSAEKRKTKAQKTV